MTGLRVNKYSLYDVEYPQASGRATAEIDKLIEEFKKGYDKIKEAFAYVGVGDTATDESIVAELYQKIHFGE